MAYYFLINKETNVVDNYIAWDGNTETWKPEDTHFVVPAETTPAIDWIWNEEQNDWTAVESIGNGGIGDVWGGEKVSQIKPTYNPNDPSPVPSDQPVTSGTQDL